MKVSSGITFEFEAPEGTDAWDLMQAVVAISGIRLGRDDCREQKLNITHVTVNGRNIPWRPKKRNRS